MNTTSLQYVFQTLQMIFPCKAFVTHCTHIWSWFVIMWMLSDIVTISFNLHHNQTFTCKDAQHVIIILTASLINSCIVKMLVFRNFLS